MLNILSYLCLPVEFHILRTAYYQNQSKGGYDFISYFFVVLSVLFFFKLAKIFSPIMCVFSFQFFTMLLIFMELSIVGLFLEEVDCYSIA